MKREVANYASQSGARTFRSAATPERPTAVQIEVKPFSKGGRDVIRMPLPPHPQGLSLPTYRVSNFANPEGIPQQSPGLRGTSNPGFVALGEPTPTGLCPWVPERSHNPVGGCYEIQNTKCQKLGDFADFQGSGFRFPANLDAAVGVSKRPSNLDCLVRSLVRLP